MKPRHAAALALVGWYLMSAPLVTVNRSCGADRDLGGCPVLNDYMATWDIHAPIRRWEIVGTFHTEKECKAHRGVNPLEQCIATDDPRLKEK
jgi:hypothetical protein